LKLLFSESEFQDLKRKSRHWPNAGEIQTDPKEYLLWEILPADTGANREIISSKIAPTHPEHRWSLGGENSRTRLAALGVGVKSAAGPTS
jgi:hypothetical protein